jgi:hypothetical protein
LVFFFGGLAIGSLFWGWVASQWDLSGALISSGIGLLMANIISYFVRLEGIPLLDHTPAHDSPAPIGELKIHHQHGPIMVSVEYSVKKHNHPNFIEAIAGLRRIRLRDGAYFWSLFHDIEKPEQYLECFMIESWLEHLRFHERISVSDRNTQLKVLSFHEGPHKPLVKHYVAAPIGLKQPPSNS